MAVDFLARCRRRSDETDALARTLLLVLGLAHAAAALLAALAPALAWPWALPPLHARCIAALQAAAAGAWLLAARERDDAARRIPMAQQFAGALCTLVLVALRRPELPPAGWGWLALHALSAVGAGRCLWARAELQAPAERPDRAWLACGVAAGVMAALLAIDPARAARVWPWPLGPLPALLYAGPLAGWSVALVMLARERRRGVRALVLWGLLPLGPLVALATGWHLGTFHHPAAGGAWAAAFGAVSVLAARRLRRVRPSVPPGARRRPPAPP